MTDTIMGRDWAEIQAMQMRQPSARRTIDVNAPGDYGADPIGDGTFRMVPSGDIVTYEERMRRLPRR